MESYINRAHDFGRYHLSGLILNLSVDAKRELSDLLIDRGFENEFCSAGLNVVREVTSGERVTGYELLMEGDLFIDVRGNHNLKGAHQYTLISVEGIDEKEPFESDQSSVERLFALSKYAVTSRENYSRVTPIVSSTILGGASAAGVVAYFSSNSSWWATTLGGIFGLVFGAVGGLNHTALRINALNTELREAKSVAEQSLTEFQNKYEPHTLYDQQALKKALGV